MYYTQLLSSTLTSTGIGDITDGVGSISEAIHKYGIAIVVMAVFFVIFLLLMILLLRNNARMMDQMMKSQDTHNTIDQDIINKLVDNALAGKDNKEKAEITGMVNELKNSLHNLENTINNNNNSHDSPEEDYHKDLVGAYIDINMAFKDISRSTLVDLGCDRIAIYIFHNGNKSMMGLPFFKMSCIHEWTTYGSNTLRGKSHTDMPLHMFYDFIENLWNTGFYKTEDVEKAILIDHSIKEFTAFSNTKSLYIIAIKNDSNVITGFVVAEFNNIETFDRNPARDKEVRDLMNNMILKISPIVCNQYIYRSPSCE